MMLVEAMPLGSLQEVQSAVQRAIELEHATIPPYLTALYSLIPGKNDAIADILQGIVIQEMQHMGLAANILNAIGGSPAIDAADFIPKYPGGLPFHIGDRNGKRFDVILQKFSLDAVTDIFAHIEEPDEPLKFPVATELFALQQNQYSTIGDFYRDLRASLEATWFTGPAGNQLSGFVSPVGNLKDAQDAIDLIVAQGEGSTTSPFDGEGTEIAHYYRFEEILNGRTLIPDLVTKFRYGGDPIPFDATGVYPIMANAASSDYPKDSAARVQSDLFNQIYSKLLRALHITFNGQPKYLQTAVGLMFDLKIQAIKLMQIEVKSGVNAAPTFEFVASV